MSKIKLLKALMKDHSENYQIFWKSSYVFEAAAQR